MRLVRWSLGRPSPPVSEGGVIRAKLLPAVRLLITANNGDCICLSLLLENQLSRRIVGRRSVREMLISTLNQMTTVDLGKQLAPDA